MLEGHVISESLSEKSKTIQFSLITSGFKLNIWCILLSLATSGIGSSIFGVPIFTNISTIFIYAALFIQLITRNLYVSKSLGIILILIIIQTFIFNVKNIFLPLSIKYFIGIVLFSFTIFNFLSVYRNRILDITRYYYKFTFLLASVGIFQTILFIITGISFIPQNFISGLPLAGGSFNFEPEILNVLPRSLGLSTEPGHYAILILPGVYISLLVLTGKTFSLKIYNKLIASIILIGFILSFSIVGYFGLLLCLLSIFGGVLKGKLFIKLVIIVFSGIIIYFVSLTSLSSKLTTLPKMFKEASSYNYSTSDLSGFALASNFLVTRDGLIKSHYFGTGLNSHQKTYDDLIYRIFNRSQVIFELNRRDAGSMFLRIPSEFGIPGIILFISFLYKFNLKKIHTFSEYKIINRMTLIIILSYAVRNGEYLSVYFIFLLAMYYYSYLMGENSTVNTD